MTSQRIRPFALGSVLVDPPLALAPMAGLTHSAFRRMIVSRGGCGLVVTEMINAAAFSPKALRSHRMLHIHPSEHPIAVQISGHDPARIAEAAAIAQEHGADLVDINAGCPARQVTGNGAGAALLRDLARLEAILRAVRLAVTLPVTLKFRSGWDSRSIVALETARVAEACGCAAITLHPRTRSQGYKGQANWDLIRVVVEQVPIPVFASGDIRSVEDALRCFEVTGAAGLMIGRQVVVNPWILAQIAACLDGQEPPHPSIGEQYRFVRDYVDLLQESIPSDHGRLGKLKYLVGKMRFGLPGKAAFRQEVMRSSSFTEALEVIARCFAPYLDREPLPGEHPRLDLAPQQGM